MNLIFKDKLHPLYEQEGYDGISTIVFKEDSMEEYVRKINNKSENELKTKINEFIKLVDEINRTNKKILELEKATEELEKDLIKDPIAKQIIEQLNNRKKYNEKIIKKLTKISWLFLFFSIYL